jgi:hypothetical protein
VERRSELDHLSGRTAHQRRCQPRKTAGIGGQGVADPHAGVMADHREPPVAQRVHQRDQISGEGGGVVPARGLAGQPAPALVGRDDGEVPGITRRQAYQVWGQPCTSSSGGPSPPVTICWRRPPAWMYRLVNVPVDPPGRCGAPPGRAGAFWDERVGRS